MKGTEIVVLTSAILLFGFVLNLVRQRRLREEYSWLWLAAASFYLVMAIWPELIAKVSSLIGITNTITAFIFFSLFFIVLILINYSVKLSKLTNKIKDIAQIVAIIEADQNEQNHFHEIREIEETHGKQDLTPGNEETLWLQAAKGKQSGE
jgi:hypothetical protein